MGLELVLPLGVITSLITPVMGISWPFILLKECFDMPSSIGYGDFVRVCWSSRRYDRVYLGSFIFGLVWRLFAMQASRRSVKTHYSFCSIGSSLSTGFQVYLSKSWRPYVSPSCTIFFFYSSFPLFWHVDFVTIYQRDGFRVCLFFALGSVYADQGNRMQFFGSRISFLGSSLFFC